jgi:hypothetical protein
MKQTTSFVKRVVLLGCAVVAASGAAVVAQTPTVIYDNTTNYLGQFFYTANEFGDQIAFSGTATERTVTDFKVEYYLAPTTDNNETARVRLYNNDGPGQAPGSLLFDTGDVSITSGTSGYNYLDLQNLGLRVQDGITWTILFGGIEAGENVGVLLYNPPTVGSSFDDFWENSTGGWGTKTLPGTVANFGAQVLAVPEPSTMTLMLLGGISAIGLAIRRRK